jgi:hypothetical protein
VEIANPSQRSSYCGKCLSVCRKKICPFLVLQFASDWHTTVWTYVVCVLWVRIVCAYVCMHCALSV